MRNGIFLCAAISCLILIGCQPVEESESDPPEILTCDGCSTQTHCDGANCSKKGNRATDADPGGKGGDGSSMNGNQTDGSSTGGADTKPDPPAVEKCEKSTDCKKGYVCAYPPCDSCGDSGPTEGICVKGSGAACSSSDFCANGSGFDRVLAGGERWYACADGSDCPTADGHLNGLCVDLDSSDSRRACAPLCQYHDDPDNMKCVNDPRLGLNSSCSRDHIRLLMAVSVYFRCASYGVADYRCKGKNANLSADLEWTTKCLLDHLAKGETSCAQLAIGKNSCFYDAQDNQDAKQTTDQFIDGVDKNLDLQTRKLGGGGGGGGGDDQCGTNCDCGHCWYCEKQSSGNVCRYGGEGPYGCYRGCD